MSKKTKKVLSFALAALMLLSVCFTAACGDEKTPNTDKNNTVAKKDYTYKSYTTALGTNWNPHAWDTNADQSILGYISSPFVDMSIKDSENGVYQWVFEMATDIVDVTKENQADLTKYGCTLPEGATADTTEAGYVFEIKLNPDAKWENGVAINADSYIYSMKALLDPAMRNYRANLYIAGESALAGAAGYYNSKAPIYEAVVPAYGADETPDYSFDLTANKVYLNTKSATTFTSSYTIADLVDLGYVDGDAVTKLNETANPYDFIEITDKNKEDALAILDSFCAAFGLSVYNEDGSVNEEIYKEFLFYNTGKFSEEVSYDKVGCYKVDDYTIRYVTQTYIDQNYFYTAMTDTWLVYEELYEAGKEYDGDLVTTNYGTSKETSMSYGTYKISSLQEEKQIVFVQNENWYGFEKQDDGSLISYTNFEVDGEKKQQYMTTKIVIDVMDDAAAKQAFLKGELSEWAPPAEELSTYSKSDQLYKVDETYTMSFFFNTNKGMLEIMDESKGNQNSVVLSNTNFRKAFSLAIDRAEYVTATQGYQPAFSLMNQLYFYDVYNDPTSSYRSSEEAMQAIVNLYGVEYGEGTPYATLKEAHDSITGYNLTEAKALMKTACDELVADGLYTAGEEIKIKIGWAKGALTSDDNKQVALMNNFINAAIEGSGFGKITFEAVGNIDNRYDAVPAGEYAIGYGAWGGAAFYPFRNFQVYMDPSQYSINEAANYDPTTEEITLTVNGEEVTMTWQAWSNCMIGAGAYATADFDTKLAITAQLEEAFLKTYYRIPLAGTTICSMLSFQLKYYTESYNIMYGFGGLRLMSYNYDDAAWTKFVAEQGDNFKYE